MGAINLYRNEVTVSDEKINKITSEIAATLKKELPKEAQNFEVIENILLEVAGTIKNMPIKL